MIRTILFLFVSGMALALLTGCETTGGVSESVPAHFDCREETESYRGDPDNEIEMFKKCMEGKGYTADGKPLKTQ